MENTVLHKADTEDTQITDGYKLILALVLVVGTILTEYNLALRVLMM
jgi:hypothetical protein